MIVRRRPEEVGLWVEMKTRADLGSAGVSRGLVDADLGPAGVDLSKDDASCLRVACPVFRLWGKAHEKLIRTRRGPLREVF